MKLHKLTAYFSGKLTLIHRSEKSVSLCEKGSECGENTQNSPLKLLVN